MLKLSQVAPHEWEFVYPDIYDDLMDEFLRSLVPERIWIKLMSQRQQYETDYLESRE